MSGREFGEDIVKAHTQHFSMACGTAILCIAFPFAASNAMAQNRVVQAGVRAPTLPVAPSAPQAPKAPSFSEPRTVAAADLLASDKAFDKSAEKSPEGMADTSALRAAASVPELTIEGQLPRSATAAANSSEGSTQQIGSVPPLAVPSQNSQQGNIDLSGTAQLGTALSGNANTNAGNAALSAASNADSAGTTEGKIQLSTNIPSKTKAQEKGAGGTDETAAAGNLPPLNFSADTAQPFTFNLWQSVSIVTFLLAAVGTGGFMMVRLKNKGGFGLQKSEKQMAVVSSLSIGPKRTILLLKIRDQEIAVASTEHGIQFLSAIQSGGKAASQPTQNISLEQEPLRTLPRAARSELQREAQRDAVREELPATKRAPLAESARPPEKTTKSEILLGALKNLKPKSGAERATERPAETSARPESTLKQTRAAFPKYLANAFEQESKRPLGSGGTAGQTQGTQASGAQNSGNGSAESEENVESVTNMIREKLKEMRPLS